MGSGFQPGDIAVLCRAKTLIRPIEAEIVRRGIPCRTVGGTPFFERREIRDLLAYLRLVVNPNDELSFRRCVNVPRRSVGDATVKRIRAFAQTYALPLGEALDRRSEIEDLPRLAAVGLDDFAHLLERARAVAVDGGAVGALDAVLADGEYLRQLLDGAVDDEERTYRAESVEQLRTIALDHPTVDSLLEMAGLVTEAGDAGDDDSRVVLMTIHAAKGLEFPTVFVVGLEEGIFPDRRCLEDEELEEERRLAYVAITRAEHRLYLSHAASRRTVDRVAESEPEPLPGRDPRGAAPHARRALGADPGGGRRFAALRSNSASELAPGHSRPYRPPVARPSVPASLTSAPTMGATPTHGRRPAADPGGGHPDRRRPPGRSRAGWLLPGVDPHPPHRVRSVPGRARQHRVRGLPRRPHPHRAGHPDPGAGHPAAHLRLPAPGTSRLSPRRTGGGPTWSPPTAPRPRARPAVDPVTTGGAPSSSTTPAGASQQDVVIPVDLVRQVAAPRSSCRAPGRPTPSWPSRRQHRTGRQRETIVPVDVSAARWARRSTSGPPTPSSGWPSPVRAPPLRPGAGGVIPVDTVNSRPGPDPHRPGRLLGVLTPRHRGDPRRGHRLRHRPGGLRLRGPGAAPQPPPPVSPVRRRRSTSSASPRRPAAVATPDGSSLQVVDSANNWINPVPCRLVRHPPRPRSDCPKAVAGGTEHPTDIVLGPDGSTAYLVEGFDPSSPTTRPPRRSGSRFRCATAPRRWRSPRRRRVSAGS